jgi:hypothetical protein
MKRHLIVFYVMIIVLLLAGRYAWQHCAWDIIAAVSSTGIIAAILIAGWRVVHLRPEQGDELVLKGELLSTVRAAMIAICFGALIAGYGDVFGRWVFGCR